MQAKLLPAWMVAIAIIASGANVRADDSVSAQSSTVTITVEGLHCAGCAKKVEAKLKAINSVDKVTVDVQTGKVIVTPRAKMAPSPRLLWETVEKAGYQPTKLVGPAGIFKEKPKS